jgi:NAD(P)-dependent dehydrogenase (short-subunit alcohol dehydrogenase family)
MSGYLGLEGKRALVTGGTKGVGQAVVEALHEAGATVLTTARSRPESPSDAEHFVIADVSTVERCAAVSDAVRDRLGGIDIVAHVVGGSAAPAGGYAVLAGRNIPRTPPMRMVSRWIAQAARRSRVRRFSPIRRKAADPASARFFGFDHH